MDFGAMVRVIDAQVAIVTAAGSGTLLLAALVISLSIRRASRRAAAARAMVERTATYHVFVELWEQILRGPAGTPIDPDAAAEMRALDRLVLMYGSAGIVRAQARLRQSTRIGASRPGTSRAQFIQALMHIRRELGSDSGALELADLAEFFRGDVRAADIAPALNAPADQPRVVLASHP